MTRGGRKTGTGVPFLAHPPTDAAISALAAAQHAVLGLEQLVAIGLSESAVRKRKAAGRLDRIHATVYSLTPRSLLTREGHWLAAVLACGEGAVLSHRSAAALHGLREWGAARVDVTVRNRTGRRRAGINVHRSTTLAEADVTVVNHIPCTTVARTSFDLAEVVGRRGLERIFDRSEMLELFDLNALQDQLNRNATRAGAKTIREVLEEHYIGSTATWNGFEEAMFQLVRAVGLPEPEVNVWITLPDDGPAICGDFVWREQRLIVETDGKRVHHTHQAFERDRRRDQRATAAGWRVIRVTRRQLENAPHEVVATLVALLKL